MIACWELQRAGHLEEFASRLLEIGRSLQGQGLHQALAGLFLSSAHELEDSEAKIEIMLQAAQSQLTAGDLSSALNTFQATLQIAVDTGNRMLEGTTLNNLSQIYDSRGDYDRALEYLEQALAICREVGNRSGEGTTLNNLSQIHRARGDYDRALEYMGQSLAICREIGDRPGMCLRLFNLGHIQLTKQDTEAAMSSWLTAFQIAKETGLAQALNALEALAKQMGHEDGLGFWESLSAKATAPGKGTTLDP